MSFPKYPAYKDSGVEWIGEIPIGWLTTPLRAICTEKTAKNDPEITKYYLSLVANIGVIPYAEKGDVGNKKPEDLSKCKIVSENDFVINSMNFGIGSFGLSKYNGICSPVYIILKVNDQFHINFFRYVFENKTYQTYCQSFGNGILAHRSAISWDILKSIELPCPPLPEQQAIASFLDRECGKIDALIAEQERLIALLAEKRQAVISHAVTKGLNPNASMKDSGIPWIGMVPEGWEVVTLKRKSSEITVGIVVEPSKYYVESGIPALRSLNIRSGYISDDNMIYISKEANELMRKSRLQEGDVVAVRTGQPGTSAAVTRKFEGANCIDLIIIRRSQNLCSNYLVWFLASDVAIRQFSEGSGGAIQQHFNVSAAKEMIVTVPVWDEQKKISNYLDQAIRNIDSLIEKARSVIILLKERRAALISAAVTGKIDVRAQSKALAA